MKSIFKISALACALAAVGLAQKTEFEVASIRPNAAGANEFHAPAGTGTGGPGTADPGMYRCSKCTLATLTTKAFQLWSYQLPAASALGNTTFEIAAKIPEGTTPEEFQTMMQNLLKDRFGLTYHFTLKKMKGYRLVVAKNGSKLKESGDSQAVAAPSGGVGSHGNWSGGAGHNGLVNFGGMGRFKGDRQSAADVTRLLSDLLGAPVSDATGLNGKYDVSLSWSNGNGQSGGHGPAGGGGAGHGDHEAPGGIASTFGDAPGLLDAVQIQLGLKLVAADQVAAQIFTIDRVQPMPTAN